MEQRRNGTGSKEPPPPYELLPSGLKYVKRPDFWWEVTPFHSVFGVPKSYSQPHRSSLYLSWILAGWLACWVVGWLEEFMAAYPRDKLNKSQFNLQLEHICTASSASSLSFNIITLWAPLSLPPPVFHPRLEVPPAAECVAKCRDCITLINHVIQWFPVITWERQLNCSSQ